MAIFNSPDCVCGKVQIFPLVHKKVQMCAQHFQQPCLGNMEKKLEDMSFYNICKNIKIIWEIPIYFQQSTSISSIHLLSATIYNKIATVNIFDLLELRSNINIIIFPYFFYIFYNSLFLNKQISNFASPIAIIASKIIVEAMLLRNTTYYEGNDESTLLIRGSVTNSITKGGGGVKLFWAQKFNKNAGYFWNFSSKIALKKGYFRLNYFLSL